MTTHDTTGRAWRIEQNPINQYIVPPLMHVVGITDDVFSIQFKARQIFANTARTDFVFFQRGQLYIVTL